MDGLDATTCPAIVKSNYKSAIIIRTVPSPTVVLYSTLTFSMALQYIRVAFGESTILITLGTP